jgi:aspartate oxidase
VSGPNQLRVPTPAAPYLPAKRGGGFDILVIGDGLAGSAAALEAARFGARVALVSAGPASSERAQGGIAAAMLPEDSPRLHALDTLAAGAGLCDPDAVEMLTSAGPETVRWLESLGVHFDGGAAREAAHSRPRVLHLGGDQSGHTLMGFVHAALDREPRVGRFRARLQTLLGDGVCEGAAFSGGLTVLAGATILATGGYAGLYERTTNSRLSNGKGILEAARTGARVADLEFVQFHPTVFAGGHPFLITEALRGAGAHIVDAAGRRFIDELLPRDQVARALAVRQGDAFISAVHMDPELLRLGFPNFMRNCSRFRSCRRRTTRWAEWRPISTVELPSAACLPPARSPAPAFMAPTGWRATPSWRPLLSAAAQPRQPSSALRSQARPPVALTSGGAGI